MEDKFKALKTSNDLSMLNGLAFEEYLRQLFTDLGYVTEKTQASGDFGADLILLTQNKKIVVQAKQYSNEVGFDAIKEIHFARTFYNADEAWVVCTTGFTKQACEAAERADIKLIDGTILDSYIVLSKSTVSKQKFDIQKDLYGWTFVELVMKYKLGEVIYRQDYLNMAVAGIAYRDGSSATWETINAEIGNYPDVADLQEQIKPSCLENLPLDLKPYLDAVELFRILKEISQGVSLSFIESKFSSRTPLSILEGMFCRCSKKVMICDGNKVKLNLEASDKDLINAEIDSSAKNLLNYSSDQELSDSEEKRRIDFFVKKSQELEKEFAELSLQEIAERQHIKICNAWNEMSKKVIPGDLEQKIYKIGGRVQIPSTKYDSDIVRWDCGYYLWCHKDYFGQPIVDYFAAIEYAEQVYPRYKTAKSKVDQTKKSKALVKEKMETMLPFNPLRFEAQYDLSLLEKSLNEELSELSEAGKDVQAIGRDSAKLKEELEWNKYRIIC